ncbi:MAG: tetratricopeptide repeat protein [Candidatus Omnitrophica bacterium]|nr:tetratricopeptide repeat protein [Candidatus Omnitrophota bacterium]
MKTVSKITALFVLAIVFIFNFSSLSYPSSLDEAYRDYLSNDYEEALQKAKSLQRNDEVLYFLGLVYAKIGNFSQARECLISLTNNYPRSSLHEQGMIKLADTYFLEGDLPRAQQLYENMAKTAATSNYSSLVYLRLSQIAEKQGRWEDKKRYLNVLKEKYPLGNDIVITDTIKDQEDFFTIQVGAFSDRRNAVNLKNDLDNKYDVYIIEDKTGSYVLYKVRVGKFKDRKEAERMWGRLVKQGYPAKIFP